MGFFKTTSRIVASVTVGSGVAGGLRGLWNAYGPKAPKQIKTIGTCIAGAVTAASIYAATADSSPKKKKEKKKEEEPEEKE